MESQDKSDNSVGNYEHLSKVNNAIQRRRGYSGVTDTGHAHYAGSELMNVDECDGEYDNYNE